MSIPISSLIKQPFSTVTDYDVPFFAPACRYKVWYLEPCSPTEHVQIVHLLLSKGGTNCEIAKHLTKVCVPSKDNAAAVTPEKAIFKPLLDSKDHSARDVEDFIAKTVSLLSMGKMARNSSLS